LTVHWYDLSQLALMCGGMLMKAKDKFKKVSSLHSYNRALSWLKILVFFTLQVVSALAESLWIHPWWSRVSCVTVGSFWHMKQKDQSQSEPVEPVVGKATSEKVIHWLRMGNQLASVLSR
jgi:hypothetical protein